MFTREIRIPFPGFYESIYSSEIDSEQDQNAENRAEDDESQWPEELRLSESDYNDILWCVTDYRQAYCTIAHDYVSAFSRIAGAALGITAKENVARYCYESKSLKTTQETVETLSLKFAAMDSPKEYNFSTDAIYADIPESVIAKLWVISEADNHESLTATAKRRHSSRDGFISFYNRDWRQWGELPEWDHNQLQTLLIAACAASGYDCETDDDLTIYYETMGGEGGYYAWESAVDWESFDSHVLESRNKRLQTWLDEGSAAAKNWIANNPNQSDSLILCNPDDFSLGDIAYRCTATPDLFTRLES